MYDVEQHHRYDFFVEVQSDKEITTTIFLSFFVMVMKSDFRQRGHFIVRTKQPKGEKQHSLCYKEKSNSFIVVHIRQ